MLLVRLITDILYVMYCSFQQQPLHKGIKSRGLAQLKHRGGHCNTGGPHRHPRRSFSLSVSQSRFIKIITAEAMWRERKKKKVKQAAISHLELNQPLGPTRWRHTFSTTLSRVCWRNVCLHTYMRGTYDIWFSLYNKEYGNCKIHVLSAKCFYFSSLNQCSTYIV